MELSKVTIVDTVSYDNMIPWKTYHVTGVLMDKTTGAELKANETAVTGNTVFKAELANHEFVVFEFLFYVDGEKRFREPMVRKLGIKIRCLCS